MMFRALITGVAAATLAASTAFAGNLDATGTDDEDIVVPVAPVGSLGIAGAGGATTAALVVGGVVLLGVAAAALSDDDDDDDDTPAITTVAQ